METCETCGTETAQLITALYHLMGLGQDYHSPGSTCARCIEESQEFKPHYQSTGFEWRLVTIN
jgi:hypothetical protein